MSETQSPVKALVATISDPAFSSEVAKVLPEGITVDRFTRTTASAIANNPDLVAADRQSLYGAIMRAAGDGLLPDGRQGAITIFNTKVGDKWVKKAQWMPMVAGIILQMAKAGVNAYASSVYANDIIEVWNDDQGQHIKHKVNPFGDRGERIGAYAVGVLGGQTYVEAMGMEDLDKVRAASKSKDKDGNMTGPHKAWPDRMEQKSCLHRLAKRIPMLDEKVAESLRDDDEYINAPVSAAEPATQVPPTERPRGLKGLIDADLPAEPETVAEAAEESQELF